MLPAILALAASIPPAAVPDGPRLQFETVGGEVFEGRLESFDGERLDLATADGERSLAAAELLLALAPPGIRPAGPAVETAIAASPAAPEAAADVVFLAGPNGDRLVGRLAGGDADGVSIDIGTGRPASVPFERIERILPAARLPIDRLALLQGAGEDDRLWRRREDGGLDSLSGVVDEVGTGQVSFEGALGRMEFPLEEVVALVLAGGEPGAAPGDGLPVVLRLQGGSRLTGGLVAAKAGHLGLATAWGGTLDLPAEGLAALVCRGPGRRLLAELEPVEVEQRPTAGGPDDVLFPWRRDLSVTGRLLVLDGRPRATGLGVHAWARLAFELPPGTRALRVTAGLCDEVLDLPARASVGFRVLVDGQERARAAVLEGGSPARLLVEGLAGARRLELLADDGGDDDAGDRAAWVDGVLLDDGP